MTLSDAGEQMRARAEGIVRERYRELRERGERRQLTEPERAELTAAGESLNELLALEAPRAAS